MARTRISTSQVAAFGMALLCLLVQCEIVCAKTYVVGGKQGWDLYPELVNWPKGKNFMAGDVLVFNYNNPEFAFAAVDQNGYHSCSYVGDNLKKKYDSGHDHVKLEKGDNFFICRNMDYCGYGMEIAVHAK